MYTLEGHEPSRPLSWGGSWARLAKPRGRGPTPGRAPCEQRRPLGPRRAAATAWLAGTDYSFALGSSCADVASGLAVTSPVLLPLPKKMT